MALTLTRDFKEFLKLLSSNDVEFLLVGGYAVTLYGHIRATNDLDIWVNSSVENARRVERALREFGFASSSLTTELFLAPDTIVRMGVPPIRIEILTSISGVEFEECYAEKALMTVDDVLVPVISLARLRENKRAAGRAKDLADLENLPE
jgi:hypothetical protein